MLDTIILGTGTAGSAIATALVNAQVTTGQMTLVDCADVQKKSLITSPTFKEEDLGQPKATAPWILLSSFFSNDRKTDTAKR